VAPEDEAVRRVLLLLLALAALVAGLLFVLLRERASVLAAPTPPEIRAVHESEPSAVQLSYVELAASPHRTEELNATQVYGWLVREDDGRPVNSGVIRLHYFDCSGSSESAAEAHAQATSGKRQLSAIIRGTRVQEDGGWYVDLPGKCWLESIEFMPAANARELGRGRPFEESASPPGGLGALVKPEMVVPGDVLVRTTVSLEAPLERGAVEISFRASSGIEASGLVFDSRTAEPIPGAHVILRSLRVGQLEDSTDARGAFRIRGIDPKELQPEQGMLHFVVGASGYQHVEREVAWEPGQPAVPAFKVVLQPHAP
jgi:hypothetical protein